MIYLRRVIPIILFNGSSPFSIFCACQNIHIMPYRIKIKSLINGLHTICRLFNFEWCRLYTFPAL